MKKFFYGAALGLAANLAAAQTVTVFGVADAAIVNERGGVAGSVTKLTGGAASGSRLGVRGSEDLGDGLKALFVLEMGLALDTGASTQGGVLFGRQALVGLQHDAGTVTIGRQYAPLFLALSSIDPFQAFSTAANASNLMSLAGIRMTNSVKISAPAGGAFSGEAAYALGEVAGNSDAGRQIGANGAYTSGPFSVKLGYASVNNIPAPAAAISNGKTVLVGATYDFGIAKVGAAYAKNRGTVNINNTINPNVHADSRDVLLGVSVPLGLSALRASYIDKQDKAGTRRDARQWGVGYFYSLSKRTDTYLAYARIRNTAAAGSVGFYTVGNATEVGSGNRALNLGLRHTF
ncbi:MAG: porin [Pseudomonadota bacterium]